MAKPVNERELAAEIVFNVLEEGGYSHIVLKGVLDKYAYLEKRERAFISRVAVGTIEQTIFLDAMLNRFSKTPVTRMKPFIRNLLRVSVYQILFMDTVPDSAVCNEAVKLAQKRGFSGLKGFVNGVLRTIAREHDKVKITTLSELYSMPQWIVDEWEKSYPKETVLSMLQSFLQVKPLSIRCNQNLISPKKLQEKLINEGVTAVCSDVFEEALEISGYDSIERLKSFQEGLFSVQDVSSMFVAHAAAPKKNSYVIDVCAAPGGKALHLADMLEQTGMVEARDLTDAKVALIQDNMERNRVKNMKAVVWDATVLSKEAVEKADIVIADLPCSGLGVIGRKPDIKYRMTSEQIDELQKLQRQMLTTVQAYVKKGGTLIYSTCTVSRRENEENAAWFLEQFPFEEFPVKDKKAMLQILPGEINSDGFFLAGFKKMEN